MKKIILPCVFVLSAMSQSYAQSDSNYVEIGVNTIGLASLGLSDHEPDPQVWNPYTLTLEGHVKRLGIRVGVGMRSESITALPSDANGMVTTQSDTSRMDLRIGLGWEIGLHPRWTVKLGLDYFMAKEKMMLETEFLNQNDETVTSTRTVEMDEKGFSPFVHIQYHVTPRVSIGTELLWRISSFTTSDLDVNSESDIELLFEYEGTRRYIMMPTALFLAVRF